MWYCGFIKVKGEMKTSKHHKTGAEYFFRIDLCRQEVNRRVKGRGHRESVELKV